MQEVQLGRCWDEMIGESHGRYSGAEESHAVAPCAALCSSSTTAPAFAPPQDSVCEFRPSTQWPCCPRSKSIQERFWAARRTLLPQSMEDVPAPGQWPTDPQEDQDIRKARLWVDGCFDFAHHGNSHDHLAAWL